MIYLQRLQMADWCFGIVAIMISSQTVKQDHPNNLGDQIIFCWQLCLFKTTMIFYIGSRGISYSFFCSIIKQVHAGSWGLGSPKTAAKSTTGRNWGEWAGENLKLGRNWNGFLDWRERHPCPSFGESLPTTTPRKGWFNVARLALHHITPHHSSHM